MLFARPETSLRPTLAVRLYSGFVHARKVQTVFRALQYRHALDVSTDVLRTIRDDIVKQVVL